MVRVGEDNRYFIQWWLLVAIWRNDISWFNGSVNNLCRGLTDIIGPCTVKGQKHPIYVCNIIQHLIDTSLPQLYTCMHAS